MAEFFAIPGTCPSCHHPWERHYQPLTEGPAAGLTCLALEASCRCRALPQPPGPIRLRQGRTTPVMIHHQLGAEPSDEDPTIGMAAHPDWARRLTTGRLSGWLDGWDIEPGRRHGVALYARREGFPDQHVGCGFTLELAQAICDAANGAGEDGDDA